MGFKKIDKLQKMTNSAQQKQKGVAIKSAESFKKHKIIKKDKNIEKSQNIDKSKNIKKLSQKNDLMKNNQVQLDINKIQEEQEIVNVSFLIVEINEKFYHSLKTILVRLSQLIGISVAELSDQIINNKQIGNISIADDDESEQQEQEQDQNDKNRDKKQEQNNDEENSYSILTILSEKSLITRKVKNKIIKQKIPQNIKQIIQSKNCCILLNERITNLPPFVTLNAHQVFRKDLKNVKQIAKWLIIVTQVSKEDLTSNNDLQSLIFVKFQDYILCKKSQYWWISSTITNHNMRKMYYIISFKKYLKAITTFHEYVQ